MTPGTPTPIEPSTLPGALLLRAATAADVEDIVDLSVEAHGAEEAAPVRRLLDGNYGPEHWTVVEDHGRVVSTCVLLKQTFTLDCIELPVGQPEFVATRPDYQRRGLIRAQFEEHHRRSEAGGDLLQFVAGIPHFYRHLGYEYALEYPATHVVGPDPPEVPRGWTVDDAAPEDLPDLRRLHEDALKSSGVRVDSCPSCRGMWFERDELAAHSAAVEGSLIPGMDATISGRGCPACALATWTS